MNGDRLLHVIKIVVREAINAEPPCHDFLALYRYRVVRMVVNRAELQIVRKGAGLPNTLPVAIHPGMAGLAANLIPGALVLVAFVEGDPKQPIITHFAAQDEAGFLPVSLALDATGEVRIGATAAAVNLGGALGTVVRYGDQVAIAGLQPAAGVVSFVPGPPGFPIPSTVKA